MSEEKFDIAIIGAGPGGYVAAIKAAQTGKKVALVDKSHLGGTCLNVGCIPTKTLLSNATLYHKMKMAKEYGIHTGELSVDYGQMKSRKDAVVQKLRGGIEGLLKANKVKFFSGHAKFVSLKEIKVGEETLIRFEKAIIATGSEPVDIPAFPCDHKQILNSTSILELTEIPKTLVVVGGGYIGCEFASLFAELGTKVTIVEALPKIVMAQGDQISKVLHDALEKRGIEILTDTMVESIDSGLKINLKGGKTLEAEKALISVGRRVVSENLGLDRAGVAVNKVGMIEVNEKMETNSPGIYAIGDVTGIAMLAHIASHQGIVAAVNATGGSAQMHYHAIPAVIFTTPEIAMVGMTLEEAKKEGYAAKTGQFPFQALGKSQASLDTEGFAQIVIDEKTGQILGAQVVGHEASALIGEMAIAIQNELTTDCVIDTIHPHPTITEGWLEAALLANNTPIHLPPKR
ncbi:MAG: dihydrolipoyl dehydrogenase [Candidatus Algichlamydia australiensis]|nr:dihydrolipoyl dehydrogenase [Chlamydiales bacterium]